MISPNYADVASAVGAAVGQVMETLSVLVRPGEVAGFVLHAPWERTVFTNLDEATSYALEGMKARLKLKITRAGSREYQFIETCEHIEADVNHSSSIYIETRIQVTAVGFPHWVRQ
jgi:hypothetical protein